MALARHCEVKLKAVTYGRIYIVRSCPICGRDEYTAHINEWDWRLTCKRATCPATKGIPYEDWLKSLDEASRKDLRALILNETALNRIAEHPQLEPKGEHVQLVSGHHEGMRAVLGILINAHGAALTTIDKKASRFLLLGADCGAGKSYGAQEASRKIPIAYSAPQYTLLDEFLGSRPYQIQGLRKGCLIEGLGECAASRGVSRRYLCSRKGDPCPFLAKCPAQPRIMTGGTPTFVHAATPTVAIGAVVKDGLALEGDDAGVAIADGRLFVVDENPDLFDETNCQERELDEALRMKNFSNAQSRVRDGFKEGDDAQCRIAFVKLVVWSLEERMKAEALKARAEYSTTWTADRVAEVILELADEVSADEVFRDVRKLFSSGNVEDLTKPSGQRPCIPEQRDWTTYENPPRRRTPEHVMEMIPRSIIEVCRAIAGVLDDGKHGETRLVATLDDGVRLRVLKPKTLVLPGSTGTTIMSAGIELMARLFPAVHPRTQFRVEVVRLVPQSTITRALLATTVFSRSSARAFEEARYSGIGERRQVSAGEQDAKARKRMDVLGSLKRAFLEAALVVEREQGQGRMAAGSLQTLVVTHSSIVGWLVGTSDGETWLEENLPPQLAVERGDPWSQKPREWGSIVYWGGRGKGENLWSDCRVAVTLGDPLPNIGDMEARFGDRIDPKTGELFDPAEVAIWYSQEAVMQAHGRTRPGRAGLPTILLHAGCYAPMGFGSEDEVIVAESSRGEARRNFTLGRITRALENEGAMNGAAGKPPSLVRVARAAGMDRKTVARHLRGPTPKSIRGPSGTSATSGISYICTLIGEIPELAGLVASFASPMRAVLRGGSTLLTCHAALGVLRAVGYPLVPAERTLRRHLKVLRLELESDGSLSMPKRSDARGARIAAVVACLGHLGLHGELQTLRKHLTPPESGAEPEGGNGRGFGSAPGVGVNPAVERDSAAVEPREERP